MPLFRGFGGSERNDHLGGPAATPRDHARSPRSGWWHPFKATSVYADRPSYRRGQVRLCFFAAGATVLRYEDAQVFLFDKGPAAPKSRPTWN